MMRCGIGALAALLAAAAAPAGAAGVGAVCSAAAVPAAVEARPTVFVATDGRDDWSGRVATPAADGSDGPVATLAVAVEKARGLGPARIVVRGGDYYLSAPVELDGRDAGLAIVAAAGEAPVLHGGVPLTGWEKDAGGRWWARLEQPGGAAAPADLFVAGERQTLARLPNLPADGDPTKGWLFADAPMGEAAPPSSRAFRYREGDIPALADLTGVTVDIVGGLYPGTQWSNDTLPVTEIQPASRTVHMEGTDWFFTGPGSRYFLAGAEAFWDAPGEWWYDPASARVGYIPRDPGFDGTAPAVAGLLPTLIHVVEADDVTVSGLSFRDGAPAGTGGFGTYKQGGGAVRVERSAGVTVTGNAFADLGVAVHVSESPQATVSCNDIRDIAGNGIYVGTVYNTFAQSSDAAVTGNDIRDIGQVYLDAAGVWFQAADRIRVADNRIENTPQCGIAGGSIWGGDGTHGAVIERNTVIDANQRTADGGAIKLMGAQGDHMESTIRDNVVIGTAELMNREDGTFWPMHYENVEEWPGPISWAIYLDGRASGVTISGNVLRDNVAGIGINGGWSNIVTGNVVTGGYGSAFRVDDATGRGWRPTWGGPNRFEGNVVTTERALGRVVEVNAPDHGANYVHFERNLYVGPLTDASFRYSPGMGLFSGDKGDLAAFQGAGQEKGSTAVATTVLPVPAAP